MGTARDERAHVRGAQRGSVPDLEALFRTHWPRAFRAAFLVVHDAAAAEDIAQESFLAALRALDRFDRRRPFGPWLHRIVVNRAIDWARASALRAEADEPALELAAAGRAEEGEPYSQPLLAALGELSPDHRAVIVLRHLLEYSPREIARMLDLPRGVRGGGADAVAEAAHPWAHRGRDGDRSSRRRPEPAGPRCDRGRTKSARNREGRDSAAAEGSAFHAAGGGTRARHGPDRRLDRRGERLQAATRRLRRGVVVSQGTGGRLDPEPAPGPCPPRRGTGGTPPPPGFLTPGGSPRGPGAP